MHGKIGNHVEHRPGFGIAILRLHTIMSLSIASFPGAKKRRELLHYKSITRYLKWLSQ